MSTIKNVNLDLAAFAMECVNNVKKEDDIDEKKYKTLVKKMATLIQKNGLMGTFVFNLSKCKKEHHKEVLKNIINWTNCNYKINNIKNFKGENLKFENGTKGIKDIKDIEVLERYTSWMVSLDQKEYRLITKEVMSLFGWVKRFSEGMIEGDD